MDNLDIIFDSGDWDEGSFSTLADRAILSTLEHMGLDPDVVEISVMVCDDVRIADLNAEFREKPVPTNVLSWPAQNLAPEGEGQAPPAPVNGFDGMVELGDIALSYDTCKREAIESGKRMEDHLTHLIVHGTLHLLGYDHITEGDAALMERLEIEILGNLGVDDPYISDQTTKGAEMRPPLPETGPNGRH